MSSLLMKNQVKLMIEAGKANPGPKIASVLGPRGVPMPKFCKEFNDMTSKDDKQYSVGDPVTARLIICHDKSYTFSISDSPVSYLLKKHLSIIKGSSAPGKDIIAKIKIADINNIAKRKMLDMNADNLEAAVKMVIGTASSMGIVVEEN